MFKSHNSRILDVVVMTCLTSNPSLYFLSFAENDGNVVFQNLDENECVTLNGASRGICLNGFEKTVTPRLTQLTNGNPMTGFSLVLAERNKEFGTSQLSLWSFSKSQK
jgi:hypothetical protein